MESEHDNVVDELRATVREVCEKMGGTAVARALVDAPATGHDTAAWRTLGQELGIASIGLPEHVGGLGGLAELVAVSEDLGACLLPVPFFGSTVLAGQVLARCGPAADDALERIVAGTPAALAATDGRGTWNRRSVPLDLDEAGRISGTWPAVLDAVGARLLVAATQDAVVVVDLEAPGAEVTPLASLDLTRSVGAITLTDAKCVVVSEEPTEVVEPALDVAALVLAAEQLGGAQRCLDMTVAYVRDRHQFARPIGSFQAVKHALADCVVKVELARSAISRALDVGDDPAALAEAALVARIWCSDAFRVISAETVQLHGGIGFTWDHDAHLYFRRARADALVLSTVEACRERLANVLGWQRGTLEYA